MSDLDLLRPMAVFASVVEQGSFRAAADHLEFSAPYVSQMISDLEARLGRQLLYRSTRKIALTDAGEEFLPHARAVADGFQGGMNAVAGRQRHLRGKLRIAAPTVAASPRFASVVARFAADHPDIALEVLVDDSVTDPVAARVDLAIRIGDPGDDPRLARKLFETSGIICCAPAQAPAIKHPEDLNKLLWLRTPTMSRGLRLLSGSGRAFDVNPKRQIVINSSSLIRAVLLTGEGYALFPEFAVRDALAAGDLSSPLAGYASQPVPAYAFFTERRTELTNARAFVDALASAL